MTCEHVLNKNIVESNNIKLAYCISIHKSQGSEYSIVVMPILREYSFMLSKKLIYTGITRARKSLVLIGNEECLRIGLNKNDIERKTTLKERLVKYSLESN